jgi:hypothetical protein
MSKPRTKPPIPNVLSPVDVLKQLVEPLFKRHAAYWVEDEPSYTLNEADPGQHPDLNGCVGKGCLVHVEAQTVDDLRTELRFSLLVGHFIENAALAAIVVGNLIEMTPFHVRADYQLGNRGRMSIGFNLMVRDEHDTALLQRRFGELLQLAEALEWYFPFRLPVRLGWLETQNLEMDWEDLPHLDLAGFLDEGLKVPREERTPQVLLRIAQGLGRWKDVLQLLREHPAEFPRREWASLKCLACRELRRWLPAIRAAKEGGIRHGRYPGEHQLSPSYLHALIEGGDDIEALRILGKPVPQEPAFHGWLRGLALHRAGDPEQAADAFSEYFANWPGDVIGAVASAAIAPES